MSWSRMRIIGYSEFFVASARSSNLWLSKGFEKRGKTTAYDIFGPCGPVFGVAYSPPSLGRDPVVHAICPRLAEILPDHFMSEESLTLTLQIYSWTRAPTIPFFYIFRAVDA